MKIIKTHVQKHITFPIKSVQILEDYLKEKMGINFSEYMQNVLFNKVSEILEQKNKNGEIKKSAEQLLAEASTDEELQHALKVFEKENLG